MRVLACFALALSSPAWAKPPVYSLPVSLSFQGGSGCLDADQLAQKVSARLGRPAFVPEEIAELRLVGVVEQRDQRHFARFTLRLKDGVVVGTRVVVSDTPDCHSLDEAAVIILAVMLNVRREDVLPPEPPPTSIDGRLGVSAAVVVGLLPQPALEVAAHGAVSRGAWSLELEATFAIDGAQAVEEGQLRSCAGGGRLSVNLSPLRTERLELAFRLGAGAGAIWVAASGFDVNHEGVAPWVEARLGARASLRLWKGLWIEAKGDVGAVPVRPAFKLLEVDGTVRTLWQPSWAIGAVGAGLSYRF